MSLGFGAKIAPEYEHLRRPITDAKPHPDNARKHDLPKIAKSLLKYGQRAPIVVQASTGLIVKGNGTWTAAAQLLHWEDIAQVWQEMSDEDALGFLLADNKASDGADYDPAKLHKALAKMVAGPGLLDTLWEDAEFEDLVEANVGPVILDGAAPTATFGESESGRAAREAKVGVGTKMKEVPVVLTAEDHAEFVGWLNKLQKRWNTSGTRATIVEAVRRMGQAEQDTGAKLGAALLDAEVKVIRRQVAVQIRDAITALPDPLSRPKVYAAIEAIAPYTDPIVSPLRAPEVLPGQTGLMETIEQATPGETVEAMTVEAAAEVAANPDAAPDEAAAAAETLRAYRKRRS